MVPAKTPLEAWIARKVTGSSSEMLTTKKLRDYQLNKLGETLDYVRAKSSFYQRHLPWPGAKAGCSLDQLEDMGALPFTTAADLRRFGQEMICVKGSDIHRIVTLHTSGTTGLPKRVFFTEEDQELTLDFFHQGMLTMVKPGDRVLILLPGKVPGSVGELLQRGLARAGAEGLVHGPVVSPQAALEQMSRDKVNVLVGIPTQVLTLARVQKKSRISIPPLRSVLLTTDHVPRSISRELTEVWACQVFNHYGMTEMGLGGGVDCRGVSGYHLREADLYVEIIDPLTGRTVQEGEFGEIVFTTLTRTGMPLIRYRTGDYSRFIPEACPCGTVLRRLGWIGSRDRVDLGAGKLLSMADLDEAVFPCEGVLDFSARMAAECGKRVLSLELLMNGALTKKREQDIVHRVKAHPVIQSLLENEHNQMNVTFTTDPAACSNGNGTGKRMILDRSKPHIAAIILAAGFSSRMKSFKPLLPLGPASVLETAVRSFRKAGFQDIRVVLGHQAGELFPVCDALSVQSVFNEDYAEGMFSSVKAGVKSLGPEVDGFFLLPVDNPLIHADTLHRLYDGFSREHKGVIYPVCGGKRGHPPLISRGYKDNILSWTGEGGLRALLDHYQADALEVGTEDQGVLLDMDTPEDYRSLLKYYGYAPTPTEFECYELLRENNIPDKVLKHCETVTRLSVFLGEQLRHAGLHLNLELLRASALLHDIARLKPNHPQEGAKLTAAYPEVSAIIAAHMDCPWAPSQPLTEKELVYLADKLVADDRIVSLQERFYRSVERHKSEPEVLEHVYRRFEQAKRIHDRVEEIVGKSVQTLIKSNLGSDVRG